MGIIDLRPETSLSRCQKKIFAFMALLVLILIPYSNTFHASWHFDDDQNILRNKALHLTELNWQNIKKTFFASYGGEGKLYRPVACLSFALNYYFGKDNVIGYHVVNISIHFLASLFLFLFIFHTLNLPLLKAKYGPNSYFIALLATVLWTINPVQTQAVTYIVQRMASMAAMFYVMSMYFYLKGRISEKKLLKALHYFLCLATGILALGSKETAAMLPISIFLFDLFMIQGLKRQHIKKNSIIFLILALIILLLGLILAGPSILSIKKLLGGYHVRSFTLLERLLTEPRIILFYISLLLYPMPNRLCLTHNFTISHNLINPPMTIISIFLVSALLIIAIIKSKKYPFISYCIIFFFLNHLIESSIFPLELIFEHRNYLPSMLFFAPLAILALRSIQFFSHKQGMQLILSAFIILILISEGHSTFMRNFIWKTEESLWLDAVEKNPTSPRAHHNLGRYYGQKGYKDKEMAEYQTALRLKRDPHSVTDHVTHYNIALIYLKNNEEDKALKHLFKTIELDPSFFNAYNNIGAILMKKGQYDEALNYFVKSLTYNKDNVKAHNNLGHILIKKGMIEAAIDEFKKALGIEKDFQSALRGLGIAHKHKKEYRKARYYFERALKENKKNVLTRLHLLETLLLMKDDKLVRVFLSETLDIIPPAKMDKVIKDMLKGNFPYEEHPDLSIILPSLGKAYIEYAELIKGYEDNYLKGWKEKEKDLTE